MKASYSPIDVYRPFQLHLKPYPLVCLDTWARKLLIFQSHLHNSCIQRNFQNYANTDWRMGGPQKTALSFFYDFYLKPTFPVRSRHSFLAQASIWLEISNLYYPNVHLDSFPFLNLSEMDDFVAVSFNTLFCLSLIKGGATIIYRMFHT